MDLITTHLNADFDGLASMVAARKLYPGATLVFPGGAQETVRRYLDEHDLGIARLRDVDLDAVRRLVVVDTHEPERLGPLGLLFTDPHVAVHVYDHHPRETLGSGGRPMEKAVFDSTGATTTLLFEQVEHTGLPLTALEATVLAIGIYEETGSLLYPGTTPRDLEAVSRLLRTGADLVAVADVLRRREDAQHIRLLNALLESGQIVNTDGRRVLLAASTTEDYHGDLAGLTERLVELKSVDGVVTVFAMDDRVQVIVRSRRRDLNLGSIARAFGGGGHDEAAAATVKGQTLAQVRERAAELLARLPLERRRARDLMTTPVKTIPDTATAAQAETVLTRYGVSGMPVLDTRSRYVGMLSRETVQKALFHQLGDTPVSQLVDAHTYTGHPETLLPEIQAQMADRNQRSVPILKGHTVIGIVSRTDIFRLLHEQAAEAGAVFHAAGAVLRHRNIAPLLTARLSDRVCRVLRQAGATADDLGVRAYAVGGFVRDLLLDRRNLDLDIVVEGDGLRYARRLGRVLSADVKTHARFGTAVLSFPDGWRIDVATARTEYYEYPTALPTVERSSIKQDLFRRDFTINTLAVALNHDRSGELLDFYGGQQDLHDKMIRVLHSLSFVEDPTRVFRAVRFEQRYGFRIGKETLSLLRHAVEMALFRRLSGSRLRQELQLLLSEPDPTAAIRRMAELGLLRFIEPSLRWTDRLERLLREVDDVVSWWRVACRDPNTVESWMIYILALMDGLRKPAVDPMLDRLAAPVSLKETVAAGRRWRSVTGTLSRRTALRPAEVRRLLKPFPDQVLLFFMARNPHSAVRRAVTHYLQSDRTRRPLLNGNDLKVLGIKPGPLYRRILEAVLDAELNGEIATKQDAEALAHRLARRYGV